MTRSSPLRRSQLLSSPDRGPRSSFLFDDRNTELSHRDALLAAQAEHERVREAAIRVYEMHELKEEHQRILDQGRREQERLRAEAEIAAEETRLQELKAKTIPKPKPQPAPEPPKAAEQPSSQPEVQRPVVQRSPESKKLPETDATLSQLKSQPPSAAPQQNGLFTGQGKPAGERPSAAAAQQQPDLQAGAAKPIVAIPQPKATPLQPPTAQAQSQVRPVPAKPKIDRYIQIHQELKQLRKDLMAQSKVPGSPLKGKVGTFRREIRVSIGQLTGGKGANVQPVRFCDYVFRRASTSC